MRAKTRTVRVESVSQAEKAPGQPRGANTRTFYISFKEIISPPLPSVDGYDILPMARLRARFSLSGECRSVVRLQQGREGRLVDDKCPLGSSEAPKLLPPRSATRNAPAHSAMRRATVFGPVPREAPT